MSLNYMTIGLGHHGRTLKKSNFSVCNYLLHVIGDYYSCNIRHNFLIHVKAAWFTSNYNKYYGKLNSMVLTVIALEFVDIFFPMRNWRGVIVTMQINAPITELIPSFKYRRYISTPIWNIQQKCTERQPYIQIILYNKWL